MQITMEPARRRRLSELLQWQLLMRGAPHIWDCGPPACSPLVSSRLACEARPSAKSPPARAAVNNNNNTARAASSPSPCLLAMHPLTSAAPVTRLSCHQCLVRLPYHTSMAIRHRSADPATAVSSALPCPARQASKQATWKHVKAKAKPSRSCLSRPPHVANGAKHNADPLEILCESCLQPKLSILSNL